MLIIRDAQFRAFQQANDAMLARQLVIPMRVHYPLPTHGLSDAVLLPKLEAYINEARAFGMTSGRAIADYVGLKFDIGSAFDQHPVVATSLSSRAVDPNAKIRHLLMSLTAQDWLHIREFCNLQSQQERGRCVTCD